MRVFDLDKVQRESAGVMAFGFFDCIHLGHQKVISSAIALADKLGVPSSVFLFRNNIFPIIGVEKYPVFFDIIDPLHYNDHVNHEANKGRSDNYNISLV